MPFITIKAKRGWFPPTDLIENEQQAAIVQLGRDLPSMILDNRKALSLDPGTVLEGVEVDYHPYSTHAVNPAEVSLVVLFVEQQPSEEKQLAIRDKLKELILNWFEERQTIPSFLAVDVFWGGGRGFLSFSDRTVTW